MSTSSFTRAIVIVMDSVGIGELPDAASYGDQGSNTLGNIARSITLQIPTLRSLGLPRLLTLRNVEPVADPAGAFGRMAEASAGKDSVTGHWEIAGIVLDKPFPTFPNGFPSGLIQEFEARIGQRIIGNTAASGTAIIDELGPEHMRTGSPIVYTSADSVFQIAAHEEVIPVPDLYRLCEIAYSLVCQGLGMGRVIARPFVGSPGHFTRTTNRKDYALPARGITLLDALKGANWPVVAVGKIEDLFAGRGITRAIHTASDDDGMDVIERMMDETDRGLIFANLVDFDTQFGHRNDPQGYAANLERFDARLGEVLPKLKSSDLLVVTADHGNDPTTPSTDHSREHVPLLLAGAKVKAGVDLGTRPTFADLGQTLADVFGVGPLANGTSFLREIVTGDRHLFSAGPGEGR
ncbi:MAG: phosphopentomutase [Acidobacteriota bacterium]